MSSRALFLVLAVLATLLSAGCGTLVRSGAVPTSPERVLASTRDIDATLTTERERASTSDPAERTEAEVDERFPRAPLERIKVTSPYQAKGRKNHQGIDLDARHGTAIFAAADGIVVHAGEGMRGYGLTVMVRHGRKLATLYAHMDEISVRVGDRVTAGQTLGYVGSTGNASGPHLHFEVRRDTAAVNPMKHLPR